MIPDFVTLLARPCYRRITGPGRGVIACLIWTTSFLVVFFLSKSR